MVAALTTDSEAAISACRAAVSTGSGITYKITITPADLRGP